MSKAFEIVGKKVDLTSNEKLSTVARMALQQDIDLLKRNGGASFVNSNGEVEVPYLKLDYNPQSVLDSLGKHDKNKVMRGRINLRPRFKEDSALLANKGKIRNEQMGEKKVDDKPAANFVPAVKRIEDLTEDPARPISKVSCSGCGAKLQCQSKTVEGFMDATKYKKLSKYELFYTVCYRCELLRTRNKILNFSTNKFDYDKFIMEKLLAIPKVHVVLVVDLLDMPNSIYDGWSRLIKKEEKRSDFFAADKDDKKRKANDVKPFTIRNDIDIVIVGNKFDLLPNTG
jgi:hypothetical protein